ncbi:short-chain dehydrogenase [Xylariales sp. AK1849]|nr:short-chain dehydrogenase [Xylariales sp. AK1849]
MATLDVNSTAQDVMDVFKSQADGKTFAITGPSQGGLGAGVARALALGNPKRLMLLGRSKEKIQPVIDEVKKINPNIDTHFVQTDLQDNSSVRRAADEAKALTEEIHGLINNAGIGGQKEYAKSKDGIESQFAANHIGHFLLTKLLLPELSKGKGVITNVSSRAIHLNGVNFEDPDFQDGKTYNGWVAYSQSKTANILFALGSVGKVVMETSLVDNSGITPEWLASAWEMAKERNGGEAPQVPMVSLGQGAATIVWSVLDPKLRGKSVKFQCRIETLNDHASDPKSAERLWRLSEKLIGEAFSV